MDRVQFFDSINGIQYPDMMAGFFDHFIALKELVEDSGKISVDCNTENLIVFCIEFPNQSICNQALANVKSTIIIYNRPISVGIEVLTKTKIKIILQ